MHKAILYARTSNQDRTDRLEDQLALCRTHCTRKNYHVVQEVSEDDATGVDITLPGLETIRRMASEQRFNVLVVRDLDRLSRSLVKQLILEEELKRYGVRVEYVLADFEDTPEGQLQKHIRATVAEFERAKIQERTHRGIQAALKRGSTVSAGKAPYGYLVKKNEAGEPYFEVVPQEAQIVRLIYHWFVVDKVPAYRVAVKLTKQRVPTWSEHPDRPKINPKLLPPGHWTVGTVLRIIRNRTYIGEWTFGKRTPNPVTVQVPALVSRETYDLAQKQRTRNKRLSSGRTTEALLVRRVYCGGCGYAMRVHNAVPSKPHVYYGCPTLTSRDYARACRLPRFRVDVVDQNVWRWVEYLLNNSPEVLEQAADLYQEPPTGLVDRLDAVSSVLAGRAEQWQELVETIKVVEGRAKTVIANDIQNLEDQIDQLELEQRELQEKLDSFGSTANNLRQLGQALQQWQADVADLHHYRGRRRIIEMLGITATLHLENEERFADLDHSLVSLSPPTRIPTTTFIDTIPPDCIKENLSIRLKLQEKGISYVIRPYLPPVRG